MESLGGYLTVAHCGRIFVCLKCDTQDT